MFVTTCVCEPKCKRFCPLKGFAQVHPLLGALDFGGRGNCLKPAPGKKASLLKFYSVCHLAASLRQPCGGKSIDENFLIHFNQGVFMI
jgi:hypothetical protein